MHIEQDAPKIDEFYFCNQIIPSRQLWIRICIITQHLITECRVYILSILGDMQMERDVLGEINQNQMSRYQWFVITICLCLNIIDGFDVMVMAFTAPSVAAEWSLSGAQIGLLLSSGLFGMAAGSIFLAPLADRIGRRLLILICLLATLPIASASSQPYNLITTSKYIKATAKSTSSHGVWSYHTATFMNYCPQCHSYGTLSYSKYCDGGQWTCSKCDCDYDMQTGWEKITGTRLRLRYYQIPTVRENRTVQSTAVTPKPINPLDVVKGKLHLNMLLN